MRGDGGEYFVLYREWCVGVWEVKKFGGEGREGKVFYV